MIRRISHIILAALPFLVTTGFTVHQHYCMGQLVETNVFHPPEFCCGEGADCCANEMELFQLDEDFVDFIQLISFDEIVIDIPVLQSLFTIGEEVHSNPLTPFQILRPPDMGTVLARLQVFCL